MSYDEIDNLLNKKSGLEGIAGMSDLRDIDRAFIAKDSKVVLAIDMYTERIAEYIAKYFLKLGKVDAISLQQVEEKMILLLEKKYLIN